MVRFILATRNFILVMRSLDLVMALFSDGSFVCRGLIGCNSAMVPVSDGSLWRWFIWAMVPCGNDSLSRYSVPIVHCGHGSFWRCFVCCDDHSSDGSFVTMVHGMVHCGHDKHHLHETIDLHW